MNNCQLNQNTRDNRNGSNADTTYCTPVYGQIVSTRENHNQINDIHQKFYSNESKPTSSFRKDWNPVHGKTTEGWDEFSKRNISSIKEDKRKCLKIDKIKMTNGKSHYDFFPYFDNKTATETISNASEIKAFDEDSSKIILDPMQKLVLHTTDNKICDNNSSALNSISS